MIELAILGEFVGFLICLFIYLFGMLGTTQTLGHFMHDIEGVRAFFLFALGVIFWPILMPIVCLAWLFDIGSWHWWEDS